MGPWTRTLLALTFAFAVGVSLGDSQDQKKGDRVDVLIKQLGDDDFAKREAAGKALAEIGEPALSALQEAAASGEPEVRQRAERLVQGILDRGTTPRDGEVFLFVNPNSRRCLSVKDGRVVQGPFADAAETSEYWKVVQVGDYFKLVNQESGKVLDLPGNAEQQRLQLIVSEDADESDQLWTFIKVGDHYAIKSRVNGFVAGVSFSATDENSKVIQTELTQNQGQIWRVQRAPSIRKK